jgi:hypothetical protein
MRRLNICVRLPLLRRVESAADFGSVLRAIQVIKSLSGLPLCGGPSSETKLENFPANYTFPYRTLNSREILSSDILQLVLLISSLQTP